MRYGVPDLRSKKFSLLGCTVGLRVWGVGQHLEV